MILTNPHITATLGLFALAGAGLSILTNTSACAETNQARQVSRIPVTTAEELAGPGNAVPARLEGEPVENKGVYIPVVEARNVAFEYISKSPVKLLDGATVMDESGNVLDEKPVLKTVGPVLLQSGLLIGSECGEHLRLNDAIRNGAIQNVGKHIVDLPLSDGSIVRLMPGNAFYVNDDDPQKVPAQRSVAISTHHWECSCTCKVSEVSKGPVSWDCGNCGNEGNQCKASEGNTCRINEGDNQTGTLQNCSEILEPNAFLPGPA